MQMKSWGYRSSTTHWNSEMSAQRVSAMPSASAGDRVLRSGHVWGGQAGVFVEHRAPREPHPGRDGQPVAEVVLLRVVESHPVAVELRAVPIHHGVDDRPLAPVVAVA